MVNSLKRLVFFLIALTFIFSIPIQAEDEEKDHKKILVIHSYHKGLPWTDEFQRGIEENLIHENIEIMTEYMDSYRYYDNTHFKKFNDYLNNKYMGDDIAVVAVVDNFAYDFMQSYWKNLFKDVPIIFGGVNYFSESELINPNTTGIAQNDSQKEMIELILSLHPKTKTILIAGANSSTAIADAKAITEQGELGFGHITFNSILADTFEELIEQIDTYKEDAVIIATGTIKDERGNFLDHATYSKKLIEETGLPVYAMAKTYIDDGAIGGLAVDPYIHGQMLADYINQLLQGKDIAELPIIERPVVGYVFDDHRLKEYGIEKNQLPQGSIILNGPSNFFTIDKNYAIFIVSIIILTTLLMFVFMILNIREKRAKKIIIETKGKLREKNLELEANNQFLIQSKEELKIQYEELEKKNAHIEFLAYYDAITHLMKWDKLLETLTQLYHSDPSINMCVFDVDISNLKTINDTYGHEVGNIVLKTIAQSLSNHYESSEYLLASHHSEFIIVYLKKLSEEEALKKGHRLVETALNPIKIGNREIDLQVSVGIALYPEHGSKPSHILKNANIAMMEAIKNGINNACLYEDEFYDNILNHIELEKQLKKALAFNEFELFYQPQIDTKSCHIIGFEALIRWHHPEGHLVYPGRFIGIAEETGLINALGNWVILTACKQIKLWEDQGYDYTLSINVSARQLIGTDLYKVVKNAIETYNIHPEHLEIEITETVMMQDIDRNAKLIEKLRALKVGIALDDFGTGYSSMSYIKSLPITKIKIDKSFIDHIEDHAQREIIKSIISLGQALNFIINIEGVERKEQFKILQHYKADEVQGFLFSKALPIQELPDYIKDFEVRFKNLYD